MNFKSYNRRRGASAGGSNDAFDSSLPGPGVPNKHEPDADWRFVESIELAN